MYGPANNPVQQANAYAPVRNYPTLLSSYAPYTLADQRKKQCKNILIIISVIGIGTITIIGIYYFSKYHLLNYR